MSNRISIQQDAIRGQLKRLIDSAELGRSQRLQDFLSYIVEESLAGRSSRIKGITIARAVFEADNSFDPDSNSIVRVEAGRLRRRLKEYYQSTGRQDPILIEIPKGSYAPTFTANLGDSSFEPQRGKNQQNASKSAKGWIIAALATALTVVLLSWFLSSFPTNDPAQGPITQNDQADKTDAQILFEQALIILMPPEDGTRLDAAIELFHHVQELDPNFAAGFAGESLGHSFKVLFIKSQDPQRDLSIARTLAEEAVKLDPNYSLSYSALSLAQSLNLQHDEAVQSARRSLANHPRPPIVNAMASLALLNSGKPYETIELLSDSLKVDPDESRTPYLNILSITHYVTGNFAAAVENLEKNILRNGPKGPHMDVIRAASYAQLGRDLEATAVIEKLQRNYPNYPTESWLRNFITSEEELQKTMKKLQALGLPES